MVDAAARLELVAVSVVLSRIKLTEEHCRAFCGAVGHERRNLDMAFWFMGEAGFGDNTVFVGYNALKARGRSWGGKGRCSKIKGIVGCGSGLQDGLLLEGLVGLRIDDGRQR